MQAVHELRILHAEMFHACWLVDMLVRPASVGPLAHNLAAEAGIHLCQPPLMSTIWGYQAVFATYGCQHTVLSRYKQCINRVFFLPSSTCEEVSCANLGCGNAHFNFKDLTRVEPRDNVSCKQLNTVHYLQYVSLHGHRQTSLARRNGLGSFPASRIAVVAANSKCRP